MQKKNILKLLILSAAILMIAAGILNNEFMEVWSKAVMICMECIGIG